MLFKVQIQKDPSGGFVAQCTGDQTCYAQGQTQDETLEKIRDEIRYRNEFCPCTWVTDDFVQLDVEYLE